MKKTITSYKREIAVRQEPKRWYVVPRRCELEADDDS